MNNFNDKLKKEYSAKNPKSLVEFSSGSTIRVWWQCNICANEWQTRISHRVNGSNCPKCSSKKRNLDKAKKRVSINVTHPMIALEWDDEYPIELVSRGSNIKYKWKCKNCSKTFMATPNSRCLYKKTGCPYCAGRLATEKNSIQAIRPDLVKEIFNISKDDPNNLCCNSNKYIQWQCIVCLHIWSSTINNRFRGRGCPKCSLKNSKPQKRIEEILKKNNIEYQEEYKFDNCKHIRHLPFDFAIFKNNKLLFLIEYQGEQHYFPIWGSDALAEIKRNDSIKLNFCKNENLKLFEITYLEQNNIEQIIKDLLETYNDCVF